MRRGGEGEGRGGKERKVGEEVGGGRGGRRGGDHFFCAISVLWGLLPHSSI